MHHTISSLTRDIRTASTSPANYHEVALAYQEQGDLKKAQASYIQALETADQSYRTHSTQAEVNRTLARIHRDYAGLLESLGCHSDTEEAYQQAQTYAQKACDLEPNHAEGNALLDKVQLKYEQFLQSRNEKTETDRSHKATSSSPIQEKSKQVNYLFEKALSTLSSLELTDPPSLFLVYAHNNPTHGHAEADTAKYLINKLSQIRVNLYSDQTPMGQPYLSVSEGLKNDGKLGDILTSQLCLLPTKLRDDVEPVDKVVVCCSEVLGHYLKWEHYEDFYRELRAAYLKDCTSLTTVAMREVVRKFSQQAKYKTGFHHVLTEIAFLQIREERFKDRHGIISVPLTPQSHAACLAHFIEETAVRIGDIPRFEAQAQAGQEVYSNQSRHIVLFKVVERLLFHDTQVKPFLDQFWKGYSTCVDQLKGRPTALDWHQFSELVESIFGQIRNEIIRASNKKIETKLIHIDEKLDNLTQQQQAKQLQTFQQEHKPLANLGLEQDIERFKQNYQHYLESSGEIQDALAMYVPLRGSAEQTASESFDLAAHIESFLASEEKTVLLLLGAAGSGKSTFNRYLAKKKLETHQRIEKRQGAAPLVFFIELRRREKPNQNVIQAYLEEEGFTSQQIRLLQTHQRCLFIFDGYDEIQESERNRHFYDQNKLWQWQHAKFIVTSRPEYLEKGYSQYFHPKGSFQRLQETWIAPFSVADRATYINKYVERNQANLDQQGWDAARYQAVLSNLSTLQTELNRPVVLRMMLAVLPTLSVSDSAKLTLGAVYEAYFEQWWSRWQERIADIPLTLEEAQAKDALARQGSFVLNGFEYSQQCALELTKAKRVVAENSRLFRKEASTAHALFFDDSARSRLLRFNAPLSRNARGDYQFPHKSMQEYWVARAIKTDGDYIDENELTYLPPAPEGVLNTLNLVHETVILDFLIEEVKQKEVFSAYLLDWIEASKQNADIAQGAANAITVLVRAGVQFNGADLRAIRIPGADLSYGVFDSAQLQQADLSKTNLTGIWLRHANLTDARMKEVHLGELPSLLLDDSVEACCYSSDGRYLAAATRSGGIVLYDAKTLSHLHTFEGHTDRLTSVVLSPDGQILVSGSYDKTVRLWSVTEKKPLYTFEGHTRWVTSVALSRDGRTLASGSADNTVRLWSVAEKKLLRTFEGHTEPVTSVALSPDGQTLASGSGRATVQLWSVAEKKLLHTFEGHTDEVTSVAFSPNGQTLASGSQDNTVRLWSITEKKPLHTFKGHTHYVTSVVLSPDGQTLASGSWDNTVWLWSVAEQKPLYTFEGHTDEVASVAFSPDGQTLASGSKDNTVRLWSITEKKPLHTFDGHTSRVTSVALSPDGQTLVSGGMDDTVRLWSITKKKSLHTFDGHSSRVISVALSPDGQTLVSGSVDDTVRLWSITKKKLLHTFEGHTDDVRSVVYSPDGQTLASGSADNTVQLWSVAEKKPLHTLEGHTESVTSVVWSPDGQTLASSSWDETVRLWSITERKSLHTFKGHTREVTSIAWSPDGQILVSGSEDSTVRLWSVAERKPLHIFKGHTDYVTSVALSRDGQTLASGSWDKTVRLWSLTSGQCLTIIHGFNGNINSVAWQTTTEGIWLWTGGDDKAIRRWQVRRDGNACRVTLHWASAQTILAAPDMCIQDVIGLSTLNTQLLKQRGATGEPRRLLEQQSQSEKAATPTLTLFAETNSLAKSIHRHLA